MEKTNKIDEEKIAGGWKFKAKKNKYYRILRGENKVQCFKCGKYLSGNRLSNIRRHYKLIHKKDIDDECEESTSDEEKLREHSSESPAPQSAKRARLEARIWVDVDKNKFLKCCVGLITRQNIPLRIFDDNQFFKPLLQPFENKFGTNLNSKSLLPILECSTLSIQDKITRNLKNKMLSLKVDVASLMSRSILLINIVYIEDFKFCIDTLGMLQLQKTHTAADLKYEILNCLKKYQIEANQIYSKSIDSGGSVLRVDKILQELQEHEELHQQEETNRDYDLELTYEKNIHHSLSSILSVFGFAAHITEQAANDVLPHLEDHLSEIRDVLMQLRAMVTAADHSAQLPMLSKNASWSVMFDVMKSLVKIKDYIDGFYTDANDSLKEFNWNFIMEYITAFFPLITCKEKMNSEAYIIGDFYRDWLTCELELEDLMKATPYATLLLETMKIRKKFLLTNEAFLAALYLDPRFNFENSVMLSQIQKKIAVSHLVKTYEEIKDLEESEKASKNLLVGTVEIKSEITIKLEEPTEDSVTEATNDDYASTSVAYSKLERRMLQMMAAQPSESKPQRTFEQKLLLLASGKKVPLDENVLNYWKAYAYDNDIRKVIQVALAVPATQVSMKRAFTALCLIHTNSKSQPSDATLNNLLLTKLNFHLLASNCAEFDCADE